MEIKIYISRESQFSPDDFESGEDSDGFYIKLNLIEESENTAHEFFAVIFKNFSFNNIGPGIEWLNGIANKKKTYKNRPQLRNASRP